MLVFRTIVEIAKTPGRQKSVKKTRSRTAAVAASAAKLRAINSEVSASPMASRAHHLNDAFL